MADEKTKTPLMVYYIMQTSSKTYDGSNFYSNCILHFAIVHTAFYYLVFVDPSVPYFFDT